MKSGTDLDSRADDIDFVFTGKITVWLHAGFGGKMELGGAGMLLTSKEKSDY